MIRLEIFFASTERALHLSPNRQVTHYERSPEVEGHFRPAEFAGALPPHPQDLSLDASPDAGLAADGRKRRWRRIPFFESVEATESALRLLPSIALSSAQSGLILLGRDIERRFGWWVLKR
jgi:hypothetical protein